MKIERDYEMYNLIELYLKSLDKLDDYEKRVIAEYIEICLKPIIQIKEEE